MFTKGYTPWNKGLKGYTNSGSYKKGMKAKNWSGFKKDNAPWNKGVHYTLPAHFKKGERPSIATEFKPKEKHPNWQGGVTLLSYGFRRSSGYKKWAREVKKREPQCRFCGSTDKLEADHILPVEFFPDKKLDLSNGRTLCRECHSKRRRMKKEAWLEAHYAGFTKELLFS